MASSIARTTRSGSAAAAWTLLLLLLLQNELSVAKQLGYAPDGTAPFTLTLYSHNTLGGSGATTYKVAPDTSQLGNGFGSFYVVDDNVTATAEVNGTSLGSLRGLVADSDRSNTLIYFSVYITFHLTYAEQGIDGTIVIGGASIAHPEDGGWEFPIVGGTRDFAWVAGQANLLSNTLVSLDSSSPDGAQLLFTKAWTITLYVNLFDPLFPKIAGLQRPAAVSDS